ncbi:MAG: helix-turn-helix transcriptional regulator, partial [Leucobacter sp.]
TGQVHSWEAQPGLRCRALLFSDDAFDSIGGLPDRLREFTLLGAAPLSLDAAATSRLSMLFDALARASHIESTKHVAMALLWEGLHNQNERSEGSGRSWLTREFLKQVLRAPDERLTVSACAAELGVTASYLAEQVSVDTGATPGSIIRRSIAREAQRLLSGTSSSAAQISSMLGFTEPSYFSRFFRREVGCSPSEYRIILGEHRRSHLEYPPRTPG